MMQISTQLQLEEMMLGRGVERSMHGLERAEAAGRAFLNPYGNVIFREYLDCFSSALEGYRQHKDSAITLNKLEALPSPVLAALSLRLTINTLMEQVEISLNSFAFRLGRTFYREAFLRGFEDKFPELYFLACNDLARKKSTDEQIRFRFLRNKAKKLSLDFEDWSENIIVRVGMLMAGALESSGLVVISPLKKRGMRYLPRQVCLSEDALERISKVRGYTAHSCPFYAPCIEPPLPWTSLFEGGFHLPALRAVAGGLVKAGPKVRSRFRDTKMPVVYEAANALMATPWRVNKKLLNIVLELSKTRGTKEIVMLGEELKRPDRPDWFEGREEDDPLEEHQAQELKLWKREMTDFYTRRKLSVSKAIKFVSARQSAEFYRDYERIYFVYFADTRGRLYPRTTGLSPQGSDLQRSLLEFADGKPLATDAAKMWFYSHGASKFGMDKLTLLERAQWVNENLDMILDCAENPTTSLAWLEAKKPLQFMAWALEYREHILNPESFLSYLPIGMDGTCNGCQHLSALFLDEHAAVATNLLPSERVQDLYQKVADETFRRIQEDTEDTTGFRDWWISNGVDRTVTKRTCMTLAYGVTKRSATGYVVKDYFTKEGISTLEPSKHMLAAIYLMNHLWPAVGTVLEKGFQAMEWFKQAAREIMKTPGNELSWVSPSGFPAVQDYLAFSEVRVNTRLHGPIRIRMRREIDCNDAAKHATGLAPNFIHSVDAAHLHLTTQALARKGIKHFSMIHDDYGVHAADAEVLYNTLRESFVNMYLNKDIIGDFCAKYPEVPEPPSKGTLDIRQVLGSTYFFS